jgi:hypothetical protein
VTALDDLAQGGPEGLLNEELTLPIGRAVRLQVMHASTLGLGQRLRRRGMKSGLLSK